MHQERNAGGLCGVNVEARTAASARAQNCHIIAGILQLPRLQMNFLSEAHFVPPRYTRTQQVKSGRTTAGRRDRRLVAGGNGGGNS